MTVKNYIKTSDYYTFIVDHSHKWLQIQQINSFNLEQEPTNVVLKEDLVTATVRYAQLLREYERCSYYLVNELDHMEVSEGNAIEFFYWFHKRLNDQITKH